MSVDLYVPVTLRLNVARNPQASDVAIQQAVWQLAEQLVGQRLDQEDGVFCNGRLDLGTIIGLTRVPQP